MTIEELVGHFDDLRARVERIEKKLDPSLEERCICGHLATSHHPDHGFCGFTETCNCQSVRLFSDFNIIEETQGPDAIQVVEHAEYRTTVLAAVLQYAQLRCDIRVKMDRDIRPSTQDEEKQLSKALNHVQDLLIPPQDQSPVLRNVLELTVDEIGMLQQIKNAATSGTGGLIMSTQVDYRALATSILDRAIQQGSEPPNIRCFTCKDWIQGTDEDGDADYYGHCKFSEITTREDFHCAAWRKRP